MAGTTEGSPAEQLLDRRKEMKHWCHQGTCLRLADEYRIIAFPENRGKNIGFFPECVSERRIEIAEQFFDIDPNDQFVDLLVLDLDLALDDPDDRGILVADGR